MMDFDLRAKKLQKQSELRIQEAKKKLEKETKLKYDLKKRNELLLEQAVLNKEKQEIEQAKLFEEAQLILQKSGGILFSLNKLKPYLIEGEDDKVTLPESCLLSLDHKNAFSHGHLCFELTSSSSISTYCGVREFSAEDGTIGLPTKVINSLLQNQNSNVIDLGPISIHYRKLNKITSAKFAPHSDSFFSLYQHNIKLILEKNLKLHTCLCIGDIISVWYRGKCFYVTVTELSPESYGTLIDTDVEIDFVDYDINTFYNSNNSSSGSNNRNNTHINSSNNKGDATDCSINQSNHRNTSAINNVSTSSAMTTNDTTTTITTSFDGNNSSNNNVITKSTVNETTSHGFNSMIVPNSSSSYTSSSSSPPSVASSNMNSYQYEIDPEPEISTSLSSQSSQSSDAHIVSLRIRLSNGTHISRRFARNSSVLHIFYYISQHMQIPLHAFQLYSSSLNEVFKAQQFLNNSNNNINYCNSNSNSNSLVDVIGSNNVSVISSVEQVSETDTGSVTAVTGNELTTFDDWKFSKRELLVMTLI